MYVGTNNSWDKNTAIIELIQAYEPDVWHYAFAHIRRHDLADDITQDVFFKAYRKIDSFRGESSVKTWLLAITRNVVRDYRRSAFLRRVILVDSIVEKGTYMSAEGEVMENLREQDVWKAVLGLPTKLREVLVLHAHNRLSVTEIASVLGITEATVKGRLHRARKKMSSLLMEDGELNGKLRI